MRASGATSRQVEYYAPPEAAGAEVIRAVQGFVAGHMRAATVVLPGSPYENADSWSVFRHGDEISGFAAHRRVAGPGFDVLHVMATYVKVDSLRRVAAPVLLQVRAFGEAVRVGGGRPLYWCLRTRIRRVQDMVDGFGDVLTRDMGGVDARDLAALCFGRGCVPDPSGVLRDAYPRGSRFFETLEDRDRLTQLDYRRDECLLLCGRVARERVVFHLERMEARQGRAS